MRKYSIFWKSWIRSRISKMCEDFWLDFLLCIRHWLIVDFYSIHKWHFLLCCFLITCSPSSKCRSSTLWISWPCIVLLKAIFGWDKSSSILSDPEKKLQDNCFINFITRSFLVSSTSNIGSFISCNANGDLRNRKKILQYRR